MFDLSLGELVLIAVVVVVCIGPRELPTVLRAVAKAMRSLRSLGAEIRAAFDELAEESGVKDLERDITMIKGDDGRFYESYDMSKLPTRKDDEPER